MRIAIDAHQVGTQLAGNATYITSLISALAEMDSKNEYTLYVTSRAAAEQYSGRWPNFNFRTLRSHSPFIRIPFILPAQLIKHPADILFVQYTAPPFVPSCKIVTSIHDISYEHLPEAYGMWTRHQMKLTIRHTAKRAAHIVVPSDHTRNDLIKTYRLAPAKLTVAPLAAPTFFKPVTDTEELDRIRRKYHLNKEFILAVGSIQPRKNLVRLIRAYAMLVRRESDTPHLVLVGKRAWLSDATIREAAVQDLDDRVKFTEFVPDEDLPALYSGATCFVYPSFFEGFGLPALEAMQCGTPVITGNRTSLPEVVGDAGILVDPFSVGEIAGALEKMLSDPALRDDLRMRGLRRAEQFSWNRTARQTLDIFERIANG